MIDIINKIKELLKIIFVTEDKFDINNLEELRRIIYDNYKIEVKITAIAGKYIQIEFYKNDYKAERGVTKTILDIIKLFEDEGYSTAREDTEYRIIVQK